MLEPAIPSNEEKRLAALIRLNILDTPREEAYDRITRFACEEFQVAVSLLTLIDCDRQWFKSTAGISIQETTRAISLCAHTILQEGLFVVSNALQDSRFADHPMVVGETHFRFYAGYPIHDPGGFRIGSLCIIHTEPRNLDCTDIAKLTELAKIVEDQIARDYASPRRRN